ncbi:MAG TPA: hypothetical protein VFA78_02815 [Chloroflexota bacterium]|nr:hypothetical protein [Chloroflexota bacterium]
MDSDMADTMGGSEEINPRRAGPLQQLLYAGIGAAAMACDVADETFTRLVDRGERVQEDLQQRADEMRRENMGTRGRMEETFQTMMDGFLNTLNLPSKGDLDTINTKLNIVNRKLDDIQLTQAEEAAEGAAGGETP